MINSIVRRNRMSHKCERIQDGTWFVAFNGVDGDGNNGDAPFQNENTNWTKSNNRKKNRVTLAAGANWKSQSHRNERLEKNTSKIKIKHHHSRLILNIYLEPVRLLSRSRTIVSPTKTKQRTKTLTHLNKRVSEASAHQPQYNIIFWIENDVSFAWTFTASENACITYYFHFS